MVKWRLVFSEIPLLINLVEDLVLVTMDEPQPLLARFLQANEIGLERINISVAVAGAIDTGEAISNAMLQDAINQFATLLAIIFGLHQHVRCISGSNSI